MASFSRKTGIIGALVIAGVLVAGSYIFSGPGLSFFSFLTPNTANAESTTLLLQQYAAKDSDNDGLPDWEEALYGTDPHNAHSISPTLTDGQEVSEGLIKPKFLSQAPSSITPAATLPGQAPAPDSLTDQFSQTLMTQYLNQSAQDDNDGTTPSEEDVATLAEGAMQTFAQSQEHQDTYSQSQVEVSGSGPDSLRTYAGNVEEALDNVPEGSGTESELDYFSDAVEKNDPAALVQLAAIGKAYTDMVPTEAQYAHLEIANAFERLGDDITDMSMMSTDPLRAYLGLAQYQADAASLAQGFANMGSVFSTEHITLAPGDPGYNFYTTATQAQSSGTAPVTNSGTQN
jgi:hypothetical protein